MKGIMVFLILFCIPLLAAGGQVYQWVDDQGVTHFTDDPGAVPEDYRGAAEIREIEERAPAETFEESAEESPGEADELIFMEEEGILIEDDLKEKDEVWWRSRAEKWREKVQAAYDNYEEVRLRYNEMATEFNALKEPEKREKLKVELDKMQIEMKKLMADLEQAKKMSDEVLPSQAKKAGKPLEWVR